MLGKLKWLVKPYVEKSVLFQSLGQHLMVRYGLFLPHDADYLGLRHLNEHKNNLFLDIGANQGTSALSFRCFDRQTPILSLEASELHLAALERLEKKDANFWFRIVACGAEAGELTFYTPTTGRFFTRLSLHTMTTTDLATLRESIRDHFGGEFEEQVSYQETQTEVVTVDSLGVRPSIVKIDTEGAEYEVLKGARQTLMNEQPYILIEKNDSNFDSCLSLLSEMSYEPCGYNHADDCFTLGSTQTRNIYFIPRKFLDKLPIA